MPHSSILDANRIVFDSIEGWVGDRIWQIVDFIQTLHEAEGVTGDVAEIGVHHGKLFFLLCAASGQHDACIAIDVFDDQRKNIDNSGSGSLSAFNENMTKFPHVASRIKIVSADSLTITAHKASSLISDRGIRIFSVDGGHTPLHVVNDMSIAQEIIVPFGVVMVDDFFGPLWPSVTEGVFSYMHHHNKRLAPVLIFQNKLFLTTFSEHEQVLTSLRSYLDENVGTEIHSGRWKYSELFGVKVLGFA